MTKRAPRSWRTGNILIMVIPFIGLVLVFLDPPRWVQIMGLLAMLALVFAGMRLMNRRRGAWRPSDTLPKP